jgi:hypothetical protein
MSRFIQVAVIMISMAFAACQRSDTDDQPQKDNVRIGLSENGEDLLSRLISSASTESDFDRELKALVESGDYESVFVLTHAMFELPWDGDVDGGYDAPKSKVEGALDFLVKVPEHDSMSANYWRALDGDGSVTEAQSDLLDWTTKNQAILKWDGERFVP